jgi:pantothenate kinase-related protein Tda10
MKEQPMTYIAKLERALKTAERQLSAAIEKGNRWELKEYLPKLSRANRLRSALISIKTGEINKQKAERRRAAQVILSRITKDLSDSERAILQPYTDLMLVVNNDNR